MRPLSKTLLGVLATTVAMGAVPAAADWEPNRPVEMVVMAGQGGGADRLARLFQSIIQKNDLSNMPMLPVNKGGGSGAEALRYLQENPENPHIVMATLNSLYTTPLRTDIGVDVAEFTPLALMAVDTFLLWVHKDTGITTLEEYVAAVNAMDGAWKMGGTGSGQEDSLVMALLEEATGTKHTYLPLDGGGDVARALVGGHINSSVNNPSEALSFYEAGMVVPIVAFTDERLEAFPDVPTMKELGHDVSYFMDRAFVAPADIPADAQAFYIDLLTKLSETQEWQDYAAKQSLFSDLVTGDELGDYILRQRDVHERILRNMGEISG
ncbi:MAG: Bug family tripartite tricarboxylate transporter substrate binding protein [Pseudomonadota bacterium]